MNDEEAKRLREAYTRLTEDEIIEMALIPQDQYEPGIYELITAEVQRRGLKDKIEELAKETEAQGSEFPPLQSLTTVGVFYKNVDAYLARSRLESAGIECFLADEYIISADWFLANAVGGIKLRTRIEDGERAKQILSEGEAQ